MSRKASHGGTRQASVGTGDERDRQPERAAGRARRRSLLFRLVGTNALVVTIAVAALAFTPATIPSPVTLTSALVVVSGLTVVLIANLFLLRRALAPLQRLTELMRRVDLLQPGERIPVYGHDVEVVELTSTFNEMLERLEGERRDAARRALAAQEGERRRIARELHDEIGQRLTAVLLELERVIREVPHPLAEQLAHAREEARGSLEEARRVAAQLRPEALDDLGLVSALAVLAERLSDQTGMAIEPDFDGPLPNLGPEAELVIYRVAQEALTNALRHSGASRVQLSLRRERQMMRLCVVDDGKGLGQARPGGGLRGMRERAMLLGAKLRVQPATAQGLEVTLDVPLELCD